ncbi:phytoene/squalene synthase family protein [Bacillus aerolatus]|uniref:Phytoene/squalene synthase family protein n=1 Tax=Bacillus aerolatus TaxID=2653354 RepID=A0A6I1FDG8_9BACI|nr:phytoene/squalene synthase family protein [Bacillus aerolatus]KAB7705622.1 phytoene/squalene synthase family protein [Bacillus aerolatus]
MDEINDLHRDANNILKETSRTFFIPISYLSPGLREAVSSAYLCMRAIDEIEDHPKLQSKIKSDLLYSVSHILRKPFNDSDLSALFHPYKSHLPQVTLRLSDWIKVCPPTIVENVLHATSDMAKGMADWVTKEWRIKDEKDLDDYTYCVAGAVGVMLSDIWKWYDGTETDKHLATAYGRGLQSVNILRNHTEDKERGVTFFPDGWELDDMFSYAQRNLELADIYLEDIKTGSIRNFCKIPLALAHSTLKALTEGKEKMSRAEVTEVVSRVTD